MRSFTKDRFVHHLLDRQGMICLVERTNLVTGSVHYEVVVLRRQPARTLPNGMRAPASERYPSGNDWGRHGWTYTDRTEATRRYFSLCAPPANQARQAPSEGQGEGCPA